MAGCFCDGNGSIPCPAFCDDGVVVTCPDDLCAASDECIHGDGYGACEECGGRGEIVCPCAQEGGG